MAFCWRGPIRTKQGREFLPQMYADVVEMNELSERVIGCAFQVLNTLGPGFLESVHENAMVHELRKAGLAVAQQQGITILYNGVVAGEYAVDPLVEARIIVELKAIKALDNAHAAQWINYLKATGLQLCLLLNLGKSRLVIRRFALGL